MALAEFGLGLTVMRTGYKAFYKQKAEGIEYGILFHACLLALTEIY